MIKPLYDNVLLDVKEAEQMTASGIVLTEKNPQKSNRAIVIALGNGKVNETTGDIVPLDLRVGDEVLFSKYAGTEAEFEGKEYLLVKASDILAVIE